MNSINKDKKWENDNLSSWNQLKMLSIKNKNLDVDNKDVFIKEFNNKFSISNNQNKKFNKLCASRFSYYNTFIRGLALIIDLSEGINKSLSNYFNNKLDEIKSSLIEFINSYFEQNLISSIFIIGIQNYKASLIVPISYDPETAINYINANFPREALGKFSIYNALQLTIEYYINLEDKNDEKIMCYDVCIVLNSKITYDYYNYQEVLQYYIASNLEINICSFESKVELYENIAEITNGLYYQISDNSSFKEFLNYICFKKINITRQVINKVKIKIMYSDRKTDSSVICVCHSKLINVYYKCLECNSVYCKIPTICRYCFNLLINEITYYQLNIFINETNLNIKNKFNNKLNTINSNNANNFLKINCASINNPDNKIASIEDELYLKSMFYELLKNASELSNEINFENLSKLYLIDLDIYNNLIINYIFDNKNNNLIDLFIKELEIVLKKLLNFSEESKLDIASVLSEETITNKYLVIFYRYINLISKYNINYNKKECENYYYEMSLNQNNVFYYNKDQNFAKNIFKVKETIIDEIILVNSNNEIYCNGCSLYKKLFDDYLNSNICYLCLNIFCR